MLSRQPRKSRRLVFFFYFSAFLYFIFYSFSRFSRTKAMPRQTSCLVSHGLVIGTFHTCVLFPVKTSYRVFKMAQTRAKVFSVDLIRTKFCTCAIQMEALGSAKLRNCLYQTLIDKHSFLTHPPSPCGTTPWADLQRQQTTLPGRVDKAPPLRFHVDITPLSFYVPPTCISTKKKYAAKHTYAPSQFFFCFYAVSLFCRVADGRKHT